ncbi:hypothetical protein ALC56_13479, partial [Trachymyrmex septentrionalis]
VFDAQGGLHIVGLLVGGSRKITSGALGWSTQLPSWQRTKLKSLDAATEQEGRGIPSVLAYGSSRISKTELNTPRGHREFPPHQPHPRNPRHPIAPNLSLSFRIVAFRYILLSRFLLHPPCHRQALGSLSPPLWISFFPLNLRL